LLLSQRVIWCAFSFSDSFVVLIYFFQSFRFVERQAVRGFISYLNPKIGDELIPKKSCMADAVNTRVEQLEDLTIELIGVCILFLRILLFLFNIHIYLGY
jgi:hypothetical protein